MADWFYAHMPNWWRLDETDTTIYEEDMPDELRPVGAGNRGWACRMCTRSTGPANGGQE